jgi:elongation factor G
MNGVNLLLPSAGVRPELADPARRFPDSPEGASPAFPNFTQSGRTPSGRFLPALGFIIKIRHYQDIGKIFLAKIFDPAGLKHLEGARFFRVFAESLEEIKDLADIRPGDVLAIQSPVNWRMGQVLLADGRADAGPAASILTRKYRPLLQSRIELVDAADFDYVDRILKQLADTEPSIDIAPDPATGGWQISTVGELQLDVFCRRLKKDHKCDIKIGAPSVRYLEKLKAPQKGLANASTAMGAELSMRIDVTSNPDDEKNTVTYGVPVAPAYREVIDSVFGHFCAQGVCGLGTLAGLNCRVTEISGSKDGVPLPLVAKCFSDCLNLHLSCAQFELFEPIMNLEIIIPDEFCGLVLADLAARGGIVRKLDSDGYNSIILLEIPLANTFGYTTLLRSLSKGLGVYVLTYEKHGVRRTS